MSCHMFALSVRPNDYSYRIKNINGIHGKSENERMFEVRVKLACPLAGPGHVTTLSQ